MFMTRRINIKMSLLSKAICGFNEIPNKMPKTFFLEIEKKKVKIPKHKRPCIAKRILYNKNNNASGIIQPDVKTHYWMIIIITAWYWHIK